MFESFGGRDTGRVEALSEGSPMSSRTLAIAALALLLAPAAARSTTSVGDPAFDFTKNQLVGTSVGPAWTLSDQHGQVVVLFVLGFD
jgi:hypothetical protein